jgi:UDP-N-acetylglucosamine--N-acetylmuramyl-(pentapeptide) pyrophosphoryl-undecaprenol N-acetylglucosamine transferase
MKTFLFTGGGTGGHIYPGLAVIERLVSTRDLRLVWVGNRTGMDRSIVEKAGIEFRGIPSGKFRRYLSLRNFLDLFKIAAGFLASVWIIARLKPSLVFSKGGFVSVPPCVAARLLGVPVFTHESDVTPGLATRINAKFAKRIFTAYEETATWLPAATRPRVAAVGNPVRKALYAADPAKGRAFFGIADQVPIVLVIGGSQGAGQVNEMVLGSIDELVGTCVVIHQTGTGNFDAATFSADGARKGRYFPVPYLGAELPDLVAASALVVTRSGAGTIWECAVAGKPMILIPLEGSGTRGDQVLNARVFSDAGAARVLSGAEATSANLSSGILDIFRFPAVLESMGRASARIAKGDAAEAIAKSLLEESGLPV